MSRFLYGASVTGIQQFIFQTDKLKDIIGASEIVHSVCTDYFRKMIARADGKFDEKSAIVNAAGNIRYIFDDERLCRNVVLNFPRYVTRKAPGISISQAVVRYEHGDDYSEVSAQLEALLKAQRNKPARSAYYGLLGVERCRRTGLPVVADDDALDAGSVAKKKAINQFELCRKSFGIDMNDVSVAFDIAQMTGINGWIAIAHADGNGLGQIVRKIGSDPARYHDFSVALDKATVKSANEAFAAVRHTFDDIIPLRPVVLGGDDLTIICRADIAIPYIRKFLESFECNTKGIVPPGTFPGDPKQTGLTACAGIAFVKASFPFHYGYELVEELCSEAKKDAKNSDAVRAGDVLPKSCLCFHKVQDSFTEEYSDIKRRELSPNKDLSFAFGPYYLDNVENRWTVGTLVDKAAALDMQSASSVRTHIRKWISEQYDNPQKAKQMYNRSVSVLSEAGGREAVDLFASSVAGDGRKASPAYDILSLYSVTYKNSK